MRTGASDDPGEFMYHKVKLGEHHQRASTGGDVSPVMTRTMQQVKRRTSKPGHTGRLLGSSSPADHKTTAPCMGISEENMTSN